MLTDKTGLSSPPKLRRNLLAAGATQIISVLIPLMALPYLARTLHAEAFGQVVYVQSLMTLGVLLVDFGFSWSSTQFIAANRENSARVSSEFTHVLVIQLLLCLAALAILCLWLTVKPPQTIGISLFVVGFGTVIGQAISPYWLFQGLERFQTLAIIQCTGKLLAFPIILLCVDSSDDQVWATLFFSMSAMFPALLAIGWAFHARTARWMPVQQHQLLETFQRSWRLFGSKAAIHLYTNLIPFAVGTFAGYSQLAYFSLADKVKAAIQASLSPVSQVLFPRMTHLLRNQPTEAKSLLLRAGLCLSIAAACGGIAVWIFAAPIMGFLGGPSFSAAAQPLRWLAFVPLLSLLSNMMGVQVMLPLGHSRAFSNILAGCSLLAVVGIYPAAKFAGATGAAFLVLLVEFCVATGMGIFLWRLTNRRSDLH